MIRTRRGAAAFTLIEVMLAVTVLGLGVLGLFALFAGAAKQQVDSARLNSALRFARSVEAITRERLGAPAVAPDFTGAGLGALLTNGQYARTGTNNTALQIPLVDTVWYPLSAYPPRANASDLGFPEHALTLLPTFDLRSSNPALPAFFVAEGEPFEAFRNPWDPVGLSGYPRPALDGSRTDGLAYGGAAAGNPNLVFSGSPFQPATPSNAPYDAYLNGQPVGIRPFAHARLHAGSLRIRVDIGKALTPDAATGLPMPTFNPIATNNRYAGSRSLWFNDAAFASDGRDWTYPGTPAATYWNPAPPEDDIRTYGLLSSDGTMRMLVNRVVAPDTNTQTRLAIRAYIAGFAPASATGAAPFGPDEWIERIVVERHQYRSDILLALDERVERSADNLSSLAAAVFIQRTPAGRRRAAVLTYLAEPQQTTGIPPDDLRYIPPESGSVAADRPLRFIATMKLRYDLRQRQYYFATAVTADASAIRAGQILVIPGSVQSNGTLDPAFIGANDVCRVVRFVERQVPTPEYRGYLAAAPMHDATAASPAGPLLPEAPPAGAANDPEITVGVWALQPTVKGLLPAGSTTQRAFRLTPLEGRVFLVD